MCGRDMYVVYSHVCRVQAHAHLCGGQRRMLGDVAHHSLSYSLRQALSLKLDGS